MREFSSDVRVVPRALGNCLLEHCFNTPDLDLALPQSQNPALLDPLSEFLDFVLWKIMVALYNKLGFVCPSTEASIRQ